MKCPKCQAENRETRKFCAKCGAALAVKCIQCGSENLPGEDFCGECGRDLRTPPDTPPVDYSAPQSYTPKFLAEKILTTRSAMEGERKLVTVLFADVAGFTSLSEKLDPEEVHQIMDGCFKLLMDEIHRYEGTINQFTGDGVMALFGAPVAHEDHAQRACHAALAIQQRFKDQGERIKAEYGIEFKLRIGLNSGPVIVGRIGDDLRMDYTAVGDTTNLASRMESLAKPGTILASQAAHRLMKDYFEFQPLGRIEIKGKEEPQEAFELIRTGEVATRIGASMAKGLTRFVGRRNSMAALMEAWEKARSGSGQVLGVVGEAGVGKSRLLLEFRNGLPDEQFTYLEGRCIHYGGAMAYLPFLDILRSYFQIQEEDREVLRRKKIAKRVVELDEKLKPILSPLQDLLSLKVEDEEYLKLEPKQRKERTFEALRDLLIRESQTRPLVLAVEDLHWVDKTSEEFLDYLIGWLASARILLILLHRPEYTHQWGSKSYFNRIGLDQLSLNSSAELVQSILEGGEVSPELRDLILNRAAGNPLFMEELTHTLLENGSIERRDNQFILSRRASDLQVPDTIQGIISARMDRLEENLKRIMQVASVIGREFAFRILNAISGMTQDLKASLLNLQGLEFIYEKSLFPELEYIFKHALTQEVAYNSLLLKRRKEIHERIGNAIEDLYPERLEEFYEMLAYHYSKSHNLEKGAHYSKLSGDKAEAKYSHWEALSFYKNAMDVLEKMPDTAKVNKDQLEVIHLAITPIHLLGWPESTLELLEKGVRLSKELGDSKNLATFYSYIANLYSFGGKAQLGLKYSVYAFEEARKNQDLDLMAPLAWSLSLAYYAIGEFGKVIEFLPSTIELIEEKGRKHDFFSKPVSLYSVLCMYCGAGMAHTGAFKSARDYLNRGLSNATELNDTTFLGPAEGFFGMCLGVEGDWEAAIDHLKKSIEHSEAVKFLSISAMSRVGLGLAYAMLGDLATGRTHAMNGLEAHRQTGVRIFLPLSYYFSSLVHLELGDLETARRQAEEALKLSRESNERANEGRSMILLGKIRGLANPSQIEEAEKVIQRGILILKELGLNALYPLGYLFLGEIYLPAGKDERARENLVIAEGMFQEMEMDFWLARTRKALARLNG